MTAGGCNRCLRRTPKKPCINLTLGPESHSDKTCRLILTSKCASIALVEGLLGTYLKLRFEGSATAVSGGVNFAGYAEDHLGRRHEVLCRVTAEALKVLARDCSFSPAELLTAYRSVSEAVNLLAASQYAAGECRPRISSSDIPRGWTRLGHKREVGLS